MFPEDYATIPEAIADAASASFTQIIVAAGTYTSPITISKPIWLKGAGANSTILTCSASTGSLVLIGANGAIDILGYVVVEGFKILAKECVTDDQLMNLRASSPAEKIVIRNNVFDGNSQDGKIGIESSTGTGSELKALRNSVVYNNEFIGQLGYAVYLNDPLSSAVVGNTMVHSRVGIQGNGKVPYPADLQLFNNQFSLEEQQSFAFLLSNDIESAEVQCNQISGATQTAFLYWQLRDQTNWIDVIFNYNDILSSNAAGFKVYDDGYLDDGTLPTLTNGTYNYWGSPDGPGGKYGSGGNGAPLLVDNLEFEPFLTEPAQFLPSVSENSRGML